MYANIYKLIRSLVALHIFMYVFGRVDLLSLILHPRIFHFRASDLKYRGVGFIGIDCVCFDVINHASYITCLFYLL